MKVQVYFNLHKKCLSVKSKEPGDRYGRVIAHMDTILLKDAKFKVSQAGRASSSVELSQMVQTCIHTGWQPCGSMVIVQATSAYTHYYNQAVVKYED